MLKPAELKSLIGQILALFILLILLNFALPAVGAAYSRVFFLDQIKELPSHAKSALEKRRIYTQEKEKYQQILEATEGSIRASLQSHDYTHLQALSGVRERYKADLRGLKDPIAISPFYENRSVFYFFIAHFALGAAIILTRAGTSRKARPGAVLMLALLLYIIFMSTNWLRNFWFYDTGRTIFSFVNFDLSPFSFFIQEFQALVLCVLVAYFWFYLFDDYKRSINEISHRRIADPSTQSVDQRLKLAGGAANFLSDLIPRWQVNSFFIVCAFLPWTLFYWINTVTYKDGRYIISAIIFHLYWVITWILASSPLFFAFQNWLRFKTQSLTTYAALIGASESTEKKLEILKDLTPLSVWQITAGGIAVLISLFLPFLKSFLRLYA